MSEPYTQDRILEMARSFQASRVLLTAAELDLFPLLAGLPKPVDEISATLQLNSRALKILLHALEELGLVRQGPEGFQMPEEMVPLFSPGSELSILPVLRHLAHLWNRWTGLTGIIHHGKPEGLVPLTERPIQEVQDFVQAMYLVGRKLAPEIVASIPLDGVRRILDLGGASGTYTIAFLRAKPDLRVTLFDLPTVIPMARARLERAGLIDRVDLAPGDFDRDPLPPGHHLAFLSAIVHQNSRPQNRALFHKVRDALLPGGRIVIRDHLMETSRNTAAAGAVFAINVLVATQEGTVYTYDELRDDLEDAGFREATWIRKGAMMDSMVVAVQDRGMQALEMPARPDTRMHMRFRVHLPADFALIGELSRRCTPRFYRTRIWDLSLGGVALMTPTLKVGGIHFFFDLIPTVRNQVLMRIHLPNQTLPFTALGHAIQQRVVRIGRLDAYLIGIHFLRVSETHGERLRAFLEGLARSKPKLAVRSRP